MPRPEVLLLPALLALSVFAAKAAGAQTEQAPSGDFRPHRGLYVNAQAGLGDLRLATDGGNAPGRSYVLALDVGVAAARNLVVYGELYDAHVNNPKFDSSVLDEVGVHGFGGGVKYYVPPSNLFIAGSLVIVKASGSGASEPLYPGPETETHWGLAGRLLIGREWWATPNVSFGLAGEFIYGRMGSNPPADSSDGRYDYVVKGVSLLLSTSVSAPPSPEPQPPRSSDGVHTHDGFYLSVRAGVGWLGVNGPSTISGVGVPLEFSAGFAIKTNLVLFGEYYWAYVADPASNIGLTRLDLRGFGPGIKYYLEPANIFFSGSLLLSRFTIANHTPEDTRYGVDMTSRWGPSARLSGGWEWWISREWGLGLAAEFLLGRMRDSFSGVNDAYVAKALSLLASASFN